MINADDFGITEGVNRGILEAHAAGAVSSASMLVNMPGWDDALERLARSPGSLGIGLHLNLVAGNPLTGAPTLTDRASGSFHSLRALAWRAVTGRVRPGDVRAECEAQLDRLSHAGVRVTHVDSHRHAHCLPGLFPAVRDAAAAAGVHVIRVPKEPWGAGPAGPGVLLKKAALYAGVAMSGARAADARAAFIGVSLQETPDFAVQVLALLDALPPVPCELAVHPGYDSPELRRLDPYTHVRERELRALMSPELHDRLGRGDIELVTFAEI